MKREKVKKVCEKTLKNLKKLDRFNTDLVFGAYKLEYELFEDVSYIVNLYVWDTFSGESYSEIVNRTKYGKDGKIQLLISFNICSYIRLDDMIKIFDIIQNEFERNLNEKAIR